MTLPTPLNSSPARCRHRAPPGELWEKGLRQWEIKRSGVFLLQREKGCGFGSGAAARERVLVGAAKWRFGGGCLVCCFLLFLYDGVTMCPGEFQYCKFM